MGTRTADDQSTTRQRRFAGYSSLYGPLAVVALTLSFAPLFRLADERSGAGRRHRTDPG